ncbi:MAG TPA: acyl-[ACP]--phospholipid O-acyltransferase [Aestuariivirgaceae bacterium]|nr:acyl-[ACP]--phospholipid O-acyltransferase [Aestuariivirgaceae bacterium]
MMKDLMTSRRFMPLFFCQFFSALNDNFVRNALAFLILFSAASTHGPALVSLAGAIFIAPFFLLSALGGELADKYDKALITRRLKLLEIAVAVIAGAGFAMQSVPLLMTALGLTGILSALFGPIKYGILPEHLETRELAAGNALIEAGTFAAILFGMITGGLAATVAEPWAVAGLMIVIAIVSYGFSWLIPSTAGLGDALSIDRNVLASTWRLVGVLWADRRLRTGALVVSWFWLVGAVTLSLLPSMVTQSWGGSEGLVTACLVLFVLGIATGSFLAARASTLRPNLGVVPLGAAAMAAFGFDLALAVEQATVLAGPAALIASAQGWRLGLDLFGLATAGGLFIVPAFAAVQAWAEPDRRARVIAAVNVLSAAFMVISGLAVTGLLALGVGFGVLLAIVAVGNVAAAILVVKFWGRAAMRDIGAMLFRILYRVKVTGLENLPAPGTPMLIAPNHVSLIDGPLLHCMLPIDAVFAIDTGWANKWWVKPLLWGLPHTTVDPSRPLAARTLIHVIDAGQPIVIFPEGRITVTGQLMKVYDGTAMIADKSDALVVPVRIKGAERSPFSYLTRGQIRKAFFPRISIAIQQPARLSVKPELRGKLRRRAAGMALQDIMTATMVRTMISDMTLFEGLAEARAARDVGKPIVRDALGGQLSYRKLVQSSQVLGAKLAPLAAAGEVVGVLLPNSVGVAVVFFALQGIGRVPAMLNFTAGSGNLALACKAAEVKIVLTSRAFVERGRLELLVEALSSQVRIVYLDDIRAEITIADKLRGALRGTTAQVRRRPDDPAVILFTSGSEGTPKGVALSHRNIIANAAQALARVDANAADQVFNVLPVFHSFGLTGGMIMPLLAGIPVFLYPSPLHYRIVPELVYQTGSTILFGTDTFLAGYARSAHPYDFRSLRLVVAGAEPVKAQTRTTYMEKFGVRILEGYGVTEVAPVAAMNTPMTNRPGTVGRLSPLMEARLEPVEGVEEGGRLYLRGPNVMLGYLRPDNPGVIEPPPGDWHDTGDIVSIDADGFITIRGRAKRFAKVAGEMVSLAAVETLVGEVWPDAASAVVTLPDRRKGERLVLVTTAREARRDALVKHARARGAGELLVPADIVHLDKLPVLGTGKADYVAIKAMVEERLSGSRVPELAGK